MTDEPTTSELMRAIQRLSAEVAEGRRETNTRLDKMLTIDMFNSAFSGEQRRVDGRFKDIADDITRETSERKESVTKLDKRIDSIGAVSRWAIGTALVAVSIILGIAGLLLNQGIAA